MRRSEAARESGFTLIEVLAAVLIVCLVFGLLLESVTRNVADLSRARREAKAAQVAEDQLKDLQVALEAGEKLEEGVKEEPCGAESELICQTIVTEQKLALPPDYPGDLPPSPLFRGANEPPRAPRTGQEPPLRMVQVRAYPSDTDPNTVDPFVVLVVAPVDPQALQQLQQQQQQPQQPGQETGTISGDGSTLEGTGRTRTPRHGGSGFGQGGMRR